MVGGGQDGRGVGGSLCPKRTTILTRCPSQTQWAFNPRSVVLEWSFFIFSQSFDIHYHKIIKPAHIKDCSTDGKGLIHFQFLRLASLAMSFFCDDRLSRISHDGRDGLGAACFLSHFMSYVQAWRNGHTPRRLRHNGVNSLSCNAELKTLIVISSSVQFPHQKQPSLSHLPTNRRYSWKKIKKRYKANH